MRAAGAHGAAPRPLAVLLSLGWLAAVLALALVPWPVPVSPVAAGWRPPRAQVSDAMLAKLASVDPAPRLDPSNSASLLSRILIPRVPQTDNSTRVRDGIIRALPQGGKWHVEQQAFDTKTPLGPRRMTNVVATRDPSAARRLVLAAHYDSKYFPENSPEHGFLGATDSAAPCAMLVDLAVAIDAELDAYTQQLAKKRGNSLTRAQDITLQLVFFDGEEAFQSWSDTDSVYGARQLASQWSGTWELPGHSHEKRKVVAPEMTAALERRHNTRPGAPERIIDRMDHLVLLDLLGAPNPQVHSYYADTNHVYAMLASAERRLAQKQLLYPKTHTRKTSTFFTGQQPGPFIQDDHLPFLAQGVPVVHVVPYPFPAVWHRIEDDARALDYPTMYAWAQILRVFTAEYLGFA